MSFEVARHFSFVFCFEHRKSFIFLFLNNKRSTCNSLFFFSWNELKHSIEIIQDIICETIHVSAKYIIYIIFISRTQNLFRHSLHSQWNCIHLKHLQPQQSKPSYSVSIVLPSFSEIFFNDENRFMIFISSSTFEIIQLNDNNDNKWSAIRFRNE